MAFRESVGKETLELFATVLEVFGRVYRAQERVVIVLPSEARTASEVELRLAEWKREGAVKSWERTT